jgi:hypothetical protein
MTSSSFLFVQTMDSGSDAMKVKDILKLIAVYMVLAILGSVGYVLTFRTPVFAGLTVFFYRGIAIILLWGGLISLGMLLIRQLLFRQLITIRDILLLLCAFCCIHIVLFTHLPVTADRSITVFMLGTMAGEEDRVVDSFTKEELEKIFVTTYVGSFDAFGKRLEEQIVTGTVVVTEDGEYRITDSGRALVALYDTISDWYGIDKKLIHPDWQEIH